MKAAITNEILSILRTFAYKQDVSLSELGRRAGVSKAWLSKLQHTDANLSVETASRLLKEIGYDLSIVKKGSPKISQSSIEPSKSRLKKVVECQNI